MKRATVSPIMLRIVTCATVMCTSYYIKSVLRYKCLILYAYHMGTVRAQECDDPWGGGLSQKGPARKNVWETLM